MPPANRAIGGTDLPEARRVGSRSRLESARSHESGSPGQKTVIVPVQPPAHVLEWMIWIRLHLDLCGKAKPAFHLIPISHPWCKNRSEGSGHVGAPSWH